jgi:predicted membrane channel-forming protein YqfA (hemolysin III family)
MCCCCRSPALCAHLHVAAGCVVIGMSLPTMFQARHYRGLRAAIFTMLGAWGVVPVTQLLLTNGHVWAIKRAFMLDLLMGAIYVVRCYVLIVRRVPWGVELWGAVFCSGRCTVGAAPGAT